MRKTVAWRVAQIALAIAVIVVAWRELAPQWEAIVSEFGAVHFRIGPMLLASVLVLVNYAVLIETWRRVIGAWGSPMPFGTAARIWLVSNLARWFPGLQIAAMAGLAKQAGASPFAAIGSSLLIQVVNLLAGVAVILLTVRDVLPLAQPVVIALGVLAIAVAFVPQFLPHMARWLGSLFGRDLAWPPIPYRTTLIAYAGCAFAWVLYGLAFRLMVASTFGAASGATRYYIAVYTTSYMAGYIAILDPGGVGIREGAMITLMPKLGMATVAAATVISVVSRVWLTVLETVPGLLLLALLPKGARTNPNG
jgi:hypothetical protein